MFIIHNNELLRIIVKQYILTLQEDLAKMGVMIRHYNNKELRGYIRISVGKPEQTDALMECINLLE